MTTIENTNISTDIDDDLSAVESDVAVVLKEGLDETFADNLAERLRQRRPGLIVRACKLTSYHALVLSATTATLLRWAEDYRLLKLETNSDRWRVFKLADFQLFENHEVPELFFTQAERQKLLRQAVESIRAQDRVERYADTAIRQGQPIVAQLIHGNIIRHFFPLHGKDDLTKLQAIWVRSIFSLEQPLDAIGTYFDYSISFYFAWLESYTKWLFLPALFGLWLWFQAVNQSTMFMLLIVFNTLWFSLFRKFWKRKSNALAYKWGSLTVSSETCEKFLTDPRPLFQGEPGVNPVTGKPTLIYPTWKRNVSFYGISVPVTICCLMLMLVASIFCFKLQHYFSELAESWPMPIDLCLSITPLLLFVSILNISNNIYMLLATKLNDYENYYSQDEYVNQLQAKLIVFRFFNGFLPLFYTAFVSQDFKALQEQVAALVMVRQVASNAIEVLLPYVTSKYRQFSLRVSYQMELTFIRNLLKSMLVVRSNRLAVTDSINDFNERSFTTQLENESVMPEYDEIFEDFLEMYIQLGYILLFAVAYPPVAFWCLLNNFVEIKTDAIKMCSVVRRPFSKNATPRDIGIWTRAFEALAVISVVINVSLLVTFGVPEQLLPAIDFGDKRYAVLVIGIFIEHVIFLMQKIANHVFDDIPYWLQIALAKQELKHSSNNDHEKKIK